ncbi:Rieske (2Fe-2S) protein [Altererythrobacter sp. MF3-039]|uniref:Rieske (2Fe-2S) protein n=1 Tax=Altererythrobacter sp. MF3-039 TaxID=3252901 RepID=UPI00390C5F30
MSALEITEADRAAFAGRSRAVDYSVTDRLHYLGNYERNIPSNLRRMMENAHDWEHLPFVHPSSFAAIELVEAGTWGWRCKTALPNEGGDQLIELLVDNDGHYWATTVVDGPGQGTQIHTQASACEPDGITVDVRFYSPQAPESDEQAAMVLGYLQAQYAGLYDEDEGLMLGRQEALDERKVRSESEGLADLGPEADLDRSTIHFATVGGDRACVRFHEGQWIAYAARCPHALGPLDEVEPDEDGRIACPWHGYRFDLSNGSEERERCGKLAMYRCEIGEGGRLQIFLE